MRTQLLLGVTCTLLAIAPVACSTDDGGGTVTIVKSPSGGSGLGGLTGGGTSTVTGSVGSTPSTSSSTPSATPTPAH